MLGSVAPVIHEAHVAQYCSVSKISTLRCPHRVGKGPNSRFPPDTPASGYTCAVVIGSCSAMWRKYLIKSIYGRRVEPKLMG